MHDNKGTESKQNIYKAESSKVCILKGLLYKYILAQSQFKTENSSLVIHKKKHKKCTKHFYNTENPFSVVPKKKTHNSDHDLYTISYSRDMLVYSQHRYE